MKKYNMNSKKNRSMRSVYLWSITIVFALTIVSCKPKCYDKANPDCKNYNPCYGKTPTSAYFVIEEKMQSTNRWIECDSVNGIGNISVVRFSALNDADSFIWTIGSETINTKSFIRTDFPQKTQIPVTLIVINKNPNKNCYPKDDGRDTFKRTMYTWGEELEWDVNKKGYVIVNPKPVQGIYRGYYESNPKREVTIVMKDTICGCSKLQNYSRSGLLGLNLPEGYFQPNLDDKNCGYFGAGWGTHPIAARISPRVYRITNYNQFDSDSLMEINGFMLLSRDLKTVEIDFEYYHLWDAVKKSQLKKDKFKGKKIQ